MKQFRFFFAAGGLLPNPDGLALEFPDNAAACLAADEGLRAIAARRHHYSMKLSLTVKDSDGHTIHRAEADIQGEARGGPEPTPAAASDSVNSEM